jgi:phage/plasmid-like protein (TIGR03299 family)
MAYVGQVPWHRLGKKVEKVVHAGEMMRAAGLDWEVKKQPARGAKPIRRRAGRELYSRYEIVRMPRAASTEEEVVLGIVSDRYEPLQNREAFSFFDPIVDHKTAFFETAGALGDGERVWVMAKMPEPIVVVKGDDCQKYLLLSNSHTGQGAVNVKFTAVRVVCQNTLMLALEDGQPAFRVRHSKSMAERLEEVGELVTAAHKAYAEAAKLFQRLARIQLQRELVHSYLESVLPKSKSQNAKGATPPKWMHILQLLDEIDDLQIAGVKGTMWALYNAITRFEDYREVDSELPDGRLNRVWFGSGADLKLRALQSAAKIAASI